jgi:hypothetical protein
MMGGKLAVAGGSACPIYESARTVNAGFDPLAPLRAPVAGLFRYTTSVLSGGQGHAGTQPERRLSGRTRLRAGLSVLSFRSKSQPGTAAKR